VVRENSASSRTRASTKASIVMAETMVPVQATKSHALYIYSTSTSTFSSQWPQATSRPHNPLWRHLFEGLRSPSATALQFSTLASVFPSEILRNPVPIQVDRHLDVDTELLASALPLTSSANCPQHFEFIRSVQINASGWLLQVFRVVSFSRHGGAVERYRQVNDHAKEISIPRGSPYYR